jgi:glutathione S-transferase
MKVYGHPLSSCTRKVLMALAEKHEPVEFVEVDLWNGEQKAAPHRARHPFGVVPVLEDDGFVLLESRAIIRYVDARFADPPLTPGGPREIARMNQWLSMDQSYVAPHARTLALERLVKAREGKPGDESAERAAEGALRAAFDVFDRALRDTRYLAGATFSLADVSLMPYVASLPLLRAQHVLAGLEHLGAWWARVSARDGWRRAVEAG